MNFSSASPAFSIGPGDYATEELYVPSSHASCPTLFKQLGFVLHVFLEQKLGASSSSEITIISSSISPLTVAGSEGVGIRVVSGTEEYLFAQMVFLLRRERLQAASRCSSVILAGSVTSVPTQPQGVVETEAPLTGRLSRSPGRSPFGCRDAFLLRLSGMQGGREMQSRDLPLTRDLVGHPRPVRAVFKVHT